MQSKWIAVGAGALVGTATTIAALVWWGNRRVDAREDLAPEDAGEGKFITLSDGARMHYIARNAEPGDRDTQTVILIHGLMDSAFHWHKNMDAIAAAYRVLAVDLVGFGFSSRVTTPDYSTRTFARHVRDLMDREGIERASFVGHSLGGAVALKFAHDYPERVDKLVLIAPATLLLQWRPEIGWASRVPPVSRAAIGWAMTSSAARARGWRTALGDPSHMDWNEQALRDRPARVQGTARALVAMLSSKRETHLVRELKQIVAPTLLVWGKRDRVVPLIHAGVFLRELSRARLVVVENAGHIPQSEEPARVNRLVLDFLSSDENTVPS